MSISFRSSLVLCLLIPFTTVLFAQENTKRDTGENLIPNPSFEMLSFVEKASSLEPFMAFRKQVIAWNSPTKTTPDLVRYINSENYETAHSGDHMIGILTHNPNSKKSGTWREYIQVRLNLELVEGEEYLLEYWVMRHPQATVASNNIGALLSRVPILNSSVQPITNLDLAVNTTEIINPGQSAWQKISVTYTAKGDERFLLIGNFFDNENTKFKKVKNTAEPAWHNPYYLIDDVSIQQLIKPGLENLTVKKGDVIKLDKIYFESSRWSLLPASFVQLDELVKLMEKHPYMRISINGHTDSQGTEKYNQKLSENRCAAVFNYLLSADIDGKRLEYTGFGESHPVDSNDTDEGRQSNRRVEFEVLSVDPIAEAEGTEGIGEGED